MTSNNVTIITKQRIDQNKSAPDNYREVYNIKPKTFKNCLKHIKNLKKSFMIYYQDYDYRNQLNEVALIIAINKPPI